MPAAFSALARARGRSRSAPQAVAPVVRVMYVPVRPRSAAMMARRYASQLPGIQNPPVSPLDLHPRGRATDLPEFYRRLATVSLDRTRWFRPSRVLDVVGHIGVGGEHLRGDRRVIVRGQGRQRRRSQGIVG